MSNVDLPLLRKAVEWVEEQNMLPVEKRSWHQGIWRRRGSAVSRECGTAFCVAGYVAELIGTKWAAPDSNINTEGEHAKNIAINALGITSEEAVDLFDGFNSAAAIRKHARKIANRAGEEL